MGNDFTIMPRSVVRAMGEAGCSARDAYALMALMHHRPNQRGEVGVSESGYVMSPRDVAEYAGLSSPSAARTAATRLRGRGVLRRSREVRVGGLKLWVNALACDAAEGEPFTVVPRWMLPAMRDAGLGGREVLALLALMRYMPNARGEVGVSPGGHAVTASEIAEHAGLSSADAALHALKGLRDKGAIRSFRHVTARGSEIPVYTLLLGGGEARSGHPGWRSEGLPDPAIAADAPCHIGCGPHVASDADPMSYRMQSPISTNEVPSKNIFEGHFGREEGRRGRPSESDRRNPQVGKARRRKPGAPRFPYPRSAEEVIDFVEANVGKEGYEDLEHIALNEMAIADFFEMNRRRGWTLADGSKVYDWHAMLAGFARKVWRDTVGEAA